MGIAIRCFGAMEQTASAKTLEWRSSSAMLQLVSRMCWCEVALTYWSAVRSVWTQMYCQRESCRMTRCAYLEEQEEKTHPAIFAAAQESKVKSLVVFSVVCGSDVFRPNRHLYNLVQLSFSAGSE